MGQRPISPEYVATDQKQLLSLLDELRGAVEDLLFTGLTAASKSTVERVDVTFREASRMRLLRLGSTLRIANEEISRFTSGSPQFSSRRLAFFLGRAWLLATSMQKPIAANDTAAVDRLMSVPATQPLAMLKLIMLGVIKRVVPGAFASFDFRLRAVEAAPPVELGESVIWSCVFPLRKDVDLPTEAFLHLPQKQKFKPSILLEKKIIEVAKCAVSRPTNGAARLNLGDASEVKTTAEFSEWKPLWKWDLKSAATRLKEHRPTPLDLEIELQEEIFLDEWSAGEPSSPEERDFDLLPLQSGPLEIDARLDRGPSGTPVHGVMKKLAAKKHRPPLYGVAHYESCSVIFQPLTALGKDGPEYLTISPDKISQAELVKAMKFT
jgi:hypothetical protein